MNQAPPPVDLGFLSRQTDGNAELQRDVLVLFVEQASAVRARILSGARPSALTAELHRLKGAARAIGADRIAARTEDLERFTARGGANTPGAASVAQDLAEAIAEACRYAANLPP